MVEHGEAASAAHPAELEHPSTEAGLSVVNRGVADHVLGGAQIGNRHPALCSFKTLMMCSSDKRLRSLP
ncbi:MAG: hypothetical protein E5V53_00515 [Mesorhizobium sp.]|nr:MAG: hypothetical protein E5V53_00515 [Mesorhizobium sp.]